ncbi:MAG: hypothetical protein ABIH72_04565 [archaeon]
MGDIPIKYNLENIAKIVGNSIGMGILFSAYYGTAVVVPAVIISKVWVYPHFQNFFESHNLGPILTGAIASYAITGLGGVVAGILKATDKLREDSFYARAQNLEIQTTSTPMQRSYEVGAPDGDECSDYISPEAYAVRFGVDVEEANNRLIACGGIKLSDFRNMTREDQGGG